MEETLQENDYESSYLTYKQFGGIDSKETFYKKNGWKYKGVTMTHSEIKDRILKKLNSAIGFDPEKIGAGSVEQIKKDCAIYRDCRIKDLEMIEYVEKNL